MGSHSDLDRRRLQRLCSALRPHHRQQERRRPERLVEVHRQPQPSIRLQRRGQLSRSPVPARGRLPGSAEPNPLHSFDEITTFNAPLFHLDAPSRHAPHDSCCAYLVSSLHLNSRLLPLHPKRQHCHTTRLLSHPRMSFVRRLPCIMVYPLVSILGLTQSLLKHHKIPLGALHSLSSPNLPFFRPSVLLLLLFCPSM